MSQLRHRRRSVRPAWAALAFACAALGAVAAAMAQGSPDPWPAIEPGHRSNLILRPGTRFPVAKRITIGLDKSMLIELPVDMKDVMVSKPEVLDAIVQSPRQVYLVAKSAGDGNAFIFGPDGQKLVLLEVTVARDLAPLADALARLIPGSRIKVEAVGDNVVLTGSVIEPVDANRAADIAGRYTKNKDAVVNMLAVGTKEQVLLRVQVAEMQRDAVRRIGVNVPSAVLNTDITFTKVIQDGEAVWGPGPRTLGRLVEKLEGAGLVRTLAEPTLTAVSGEQAKFLAGGEFPVPIAGRDGQTTVAWKTFGVNVAFKPVVLSEGRISLTIASEVSQLSNDGAVVTREIAIPALKVRRAETTVELPSGGTLAMAGLLSDETRQSAEGVPAIKDLPVLGALFRSNAYKRKESELVILVTPYLAAHASRREFARPDGGYAPARSLRELFMGQINRIYGPPGYVPKGRYEGDYGFVIEYPDAGVKG
jgi:pilus assembly protein CpaC